MMVVLRATHTHERTHTLTHILAPTSLAWPFLVHSLLAFRKAVNTLRIKTVFSCQCCLLLENDGYYLPHLFIFLLWRSCMLHFHVFNVIFYTAYHTYSYTHTNIICCFNSSCKLLADILSEKRELR